MAFITPVNSIRDWILRNREKNSLDTKKIPIFLRDQLASADYTSAEKACPQNMPISRLMKEALIELT